MSDIINIIRLMVLLVIVFIIGKLNNRIEVIEKTINSTNTLEAIKPKDDHNENIYDKVQSAGIQRNEFTYYV